MSDTTEKTVSLTEESVLSLAQLAAYQLVLLEKDQAEELVSWLQKMDEDALDLIMQGLDYHYWLRMSKGSEGYPLGLFEIAFVMEIVNDEKKSRRAC